MMRKRVYIPLLLDHAASKPSHTNGDQLTYLGGESQMPYFQLQAKPRKCVLLPLETNVLSSPSSVAVLYGLLQTSA